MSFGDDSRTVETMIPSEVAVRSLYFLQKNPEEFRGIGGFHRVVLDGMEAGLVHLSHAGHLTAAQWGSNSDEQLTAVPTTWGPRMIAKLV